MKKLLFTLCAAAIACTSAFGQGGEILIDKIDEDGFRIIGTRPVNCRNGMTDRHPMMFALFCCAQGERTAWSIEVDFPDMKSFAIAKGALMLIKLVDGTVVELRQTREASDVEDIVGKYNSAIKMRMHTMRASYAVTPAQLEQISRLGIAKIRIERVLDTFDVEYKKDKVSPTLNEGYAAITSAMSQQKDIRSDF